MKPLTLKTLLEVAYDLRSPEERRNQRMARVMRATGNMTATGQLDGSSPEGRIRHGRALSRALRSYALDKGLPYYQDMTRERDYYYNQGPHLNVAAASPERWRSIEARRARFKQHQQSQQSQQGQQRPPMRP